MNIKIFFTSDHHFGHENILKFTDRGFKTVQDMEDEYIKRWNSNVKKTDTVYILGDFIWNTVKAKEYKEIVDKLNGIKILIIGNHDRIKFLNASNLGISAALESAVVSIGKHKVLLSHYPYRYGFFQNIASRIKNIFSKRKINFKRFEKYPDNNGEWLIHGHTHNKEKVFNKQIHVGVDAWDGYPVSGQQILDILNKGA